MFAKGILSKPVKSRNPMEIYPDWNKTYSLEKENVPGLRELKSLFEQAAKKTPRRKDLSDCNKQPMLVCMDAENHLHIQPFLTYEWVAISDAFKLASELGKNVFDDSTIIPIFLILDPKSDPEKAGRNVQFILEKVKYAELTLIFGRRVLPKPNNTKNPIEIYGDLKKTYSSDEAYNSREVKLLYERAAKETPQRKDFSDGEINMIIAHLFVCVDAENHIHFRPLLRDEWLVFQDARAFGTKLDENARTGGPFMPAFVILDPKSDPQVGEKILQFIREKVKYAELTLMFGRRVLPKPEKSKK
jgi:hypothetical protein